MKSIYGNQNNNEPVPAGFQSPKRKPLTFIRKQRMPTMKKKVTKKKSFAGKAFRFLTR